jgi:hypothetical protein
MSLRNSIFFLNQQFACWIIQLFCRKKIFKVNLNVQKFLCLGFLILIWTYLYFFQKHLEHPLHLEEPTLIFFVLLTWLHCFLFSAHLIYSLAACHAVIWKVFCQPVPHSLYLSFSNSFFYLELLTFVATKQFYNHFSTFLFFKIPLRLFLRSCSLASCEEPLV